MTSLSAIVSARLCLFRSVSVNISGVLPGLTHENSLKPASPVCEERSANDSGNCSRDVIA